MSAAATSIPIRHSHIVHAVETNRDQRALPCELTMLQLVEVIGEVTDDEREIVATVMHMLSSGRVRLTGNFQDAPLEEILAD